MGLDSTDETARLQVDGARQTSSVFILPSGLLLMQTPVAIIRLNSQDISFPPWDSGARMVKRMELAQPFTGHMGVNLGGGDVCVAEE